MAKYSTNRGGGGSKGDSCELCGKATTDLSRENVAGAELLVCDSCAPHGESRKRGRNQSGGDSGSGGTNRKKETARRAARMMDRAKGDPSHWEREGTSYESDRLPYLVSDYGDRVESARRDAGLQLGELAAELDIDESALLAIEQGRATRAGVGGSVVRALEERLDVQLIDE